MERFTGDFFAVKDTCARVLSESGTKVWEKAFRRICHYMVSFPLSMDDANCVKLAAMEIADIFSGRYQVYYGVHEDTKYLHIHYAINAVSHLDGKKWHKSKKELKEMEALMRERAREALRC